MSRQFRSDDTSKWKEGFGNGKAGSASISGTYGVGVGGYLGVCSGSTGSYTLTTPTGWGNGYGGWCCFIHQTQGTGAGNWELNRILDITGTVSTMKYPLQNTYGVGAQCVLAIPYKNLTISATLTIPTWSAGTGGIIFLLDQGTTSITGTITANGNIGADNQIQVDNAPGGVGGGFKGGNGDFTNPATNTRNGDGHVGAGWNATAGENNGNGGGCGKAGGGGGGGGNALAGQTSPGYAINCLGGVAVGNAGLTSMHLGGGGGGGSGEWGASCGGTGGSGGGLVFILSKNISLSGIINDYGGRGGNITTGTDGWSAGGGGAGGSVLIKSMTATLGSNKIVSTGGLGGTSGSGNPRPGGYGSVGRIHLDYNKSYSGTTNPTLDVRQDSTLKQPGGGFWLET
jgi:hypothetical protein